jgi:hypothetical protein
VRVRSNEEQTRQVEQKKCHGLRKSNVTHEVKKAASSAIEIYSFATW